MNQPLPASPSLSRRRLLRWLCRATAIGGAGIALDARYGEKNWVRVAERDISLPGWPVSAAGLRVGHISDLHVDGEADRHRAAKAAQLLMAQRPDVVFVTGDYISAHPVTPRITACIGALRPLTQAPRGAYALLGNHDWWSGGGEEITRRLREAGFQVLRNDAVPLPGAPDVWLVGLDDCYVGMHNVARALARVPSGATKLLLVHEPDYADEAPPGFALQFSGHTHGGQVQIPGIGPLDCPHLGRHYVEGLRQGPHHPVYVTRGVGMVRPKIRLFCPPEVGLLRLFPA